METFLPQICVKPYSQKLKEDLEGVDGIGGCEEDLVQNQLGMTDFTLLTRTNSIEQHGKDLMAIGLNTNKLSHLLLC